MTVRKLRVHYIVHFPDGDSTDPRDRIMTERKFLRLLEDYERMGWGLEYKTEWIE